MGTSMVTGRHEEVDAQTQASVPQSSRVPVPPTQLDPSPRLAPAAETPTDGVVRVIVGHYGSGKTEVSVSLAMQLAATGRRVALGDLDIVNPYFRSRERAEQMTAAGIEVISSSLGHTLTLDLPAVSPRIRGPIGDPCCDVILDVGGNETGAKALVEFRSALLARGCQTLLVVNGYRPDTPDVAGVLRHLRAIEDTCGLAVTGLISNTHVCRETTPEDVVAGYRLTCDVSDATGLPVAFVCAIPTALEAFAALAQPLGEPRRGELLPIGLHLRDAWM